MYEEWNIGVQLYHENLRTLDLAWLQHGYVFTPFPETDPVISVIVLQKSLFSSPLSLVFENPHYSNHSYSQSTCCLINQRRYC